MREWNAGAVDDGIFVSGAGPLTNIRFADDLLLFAKSSEEAVAMLNRLIITLRSFGLELNAKKTKFLSTTVQANDTETVWIDTVGGPVELIAAGRSHKYLGRTWSGNLRDRGQAAVDHRISCSWAKFNEYEASLTDKMVTIKLRLKLFSMTVIPTLLYCLETCPLTQLQHDKMNITLRKMLRKMVGIVYDDGESWEQRGHRMKLRLATALKEHPIEDASKTVFTRKKQLQRRLQSNSAPTLAHLCHSWVPLSRRNRGHPRCRWNDNI